MDVILGLNWLELIGAVSMILAGILAILKIIPGDQPGESLLTKVLEFLSKVKKP